MNSQLFCSSPFPSLLCVIILFSIEIPLSSSNGDYYTTCSMQFTCRKITTGYPFWGNDQLEYYCGHPDLKLDCKNDSTTIEKNDLRYLVLHIDNDTQTLKIAREDYLDGICPPQLANSTLDSLLFDYAPSYGNLTIHYYCPPSLVRIPSQFTCRINGVALIGYVQALPSGLVACYASVMVPVAQTLSLLETRNSLAVEEALNEGFEVKWKVDSRACQECIESNGTCGFDPRSQTTCYCPNRHLGWFKTCAPPGMYLNVVFNY